MLPVIEMEAALKNGIPKPPDSWVDKNKAGVYRLSNDVEINVRFLSPTDIPSLLELEQRKWESDQRADVSMLASRVASFPALSIGAFCTRTGTALASLFMKPTRHDIISKCPTWQDCARKQHGDESAKTGVLFGISLSSVDPKAAQAIFEFFWPHALKAGWSDIYLGSPVPGLRNWISKNPDIPVAQYVRGEHKGLPLDPQLRYYFKKGFRKIVAIKDNYFPHEPSLDFGVLILGKVPLSGLSFIWKRVPLPWLQRMKKLLFVYL
ncbi:MULTISPECIES: hypothetical protein [unclassified Pseudomonas]|uniref:hypothetical protein n=1 Tax=unclassified Pseudomonas TaxID=196821 RepID=UPI00215E0DD5|nr:hypothetical protein [Pseudomonas sp. B21-015]UVM47883.1 hypothetical protein LOY38_15735 [Pseudomonas sp. B21-015]